MFLRLLALTGQTVLFLTRLRLAVAEVLPVMGLLVALVPVTEERVRVLVVPVPQVKETLVERVEVLTRQQAAVAARRKLVLLG
jgi:hypothetical protein